MENFYDEVLNELIELKPALLKILREKDIIVRNRKKNVYQVYWKKRVEGSYSSELSQLAEIIRKYENHQMLIDEEIHEYLSSSRKKEVKSILNLFRQDIWFDKDVHSRFYKNQNSYYRFFKDDVQETPFLENEPTLEEAKNKMIEICRKELIDSFLAKYEYVEKYLIQESNKIKENYKKIREINDKATYFFNYGLEIIEEHPAIAIILLGSAIESQLKKLYVNIIPKNSSLGDIIKRLKKERKAQKYIKILDKINLQYNKVKHEEEIVIDYFTTKSFYEKVSDLFREKV